MPLDSLHHPSLEDRVVVITGGGRGLGWVMGEALLRAGARLVLTGSRKPEDLQSALRRASDLDGGDRVLCLRADVTRWEDCERVVSETVERFGGFQALINNAGRSLTEIKPDFPVGPPKFWQADVAAWRLIVDTNLNGAFQMAKAAAPHFLSRRFGKIVNISTSLVTMVRQGYSPYGPSKAALETATVNWAKDLDGTGVTANVLLPGGATDTEFIPGLGELGRRSGPGKPLLHPRVMAAPALWLCSDLSNETTGKRYIGKEWDPSLPVAEAEARSRQDSHELPAIM